MFDGPRAPLAHLSGDRRAPTPRREISVRWQTDRCPARGYSDGCLPVAGVRCAMRPPVACRVGIALFPAGISESRTGSDRIRINHRIGDPAMPKTALTDVPTLRKRARQNIDDGSVTAGYAADRKV